MILEKIYLLIDEKFPFNLQEEWDNSGILFDKSKRNKINSILVSMDISQEIIEHAIDIKVDLIISHHPIIDKTTLINKNRLEKLKKHKIAHLAVHTNYDNHELGMNYSLIKRINPQSFEKDKKSPIYKGVLKKPLSARRFASFLKKNLNCKQVFYFESEKNKLIKSFALVGGNGTSYIENVADLQVDAFVTGDIKWHSWNEINELKMSAFDIGHDQEKVFVVEMVRFLRKHFDGKIFTHLPTDRTKISD